MIKTARRGDTETRRYREKTRYQSVGVSDYADAYRTASTDKSAYRRKFTIVIPDISVGAG